MVSYKGQPAHAEKAVAGIAIRSVEKWIIRPGQRMQ